MKYAIRAGIGIGLIPDYLTGEETELVPVLQDAKLPTMPVYFVYPEELKTRQEGAGFPRFPDRQGAPVEVLSLARRPSHAQRMASMPVPYYPSPSPTCCRCAQL